MLLVVVNIYLIHGAIVKPKLFVKFNSKKLKNFIHSINFLKFLARYKSTNAV